MIPNFEAAVDEIIKQAINTEPTDWIEWRGGDCPVNEGTPVKVRLRGGGELPTMLAANLPIGWDHYRDRIIGNGDDDIIAYKISA